jgi:ribosomal protein S18 acetylase RimI-like enzyme
MHIRTAEIDDLNRLRVLYKEVARHEGGIARQESEITEDYIQNILTRSFATGLAIVALHPEDPEQLVGAIHAYKPGIHTFDHVLSDLTVVVHPQFQGRKIGRTLFTIFLEEIGRNRHDIGRVELITRESNARAIALYQSLGFRIEGRLEMRIRTAGRTYEADIPMGWQNPNFEF